MITEPTTSDEQLPKVYLFVNGRWGSGDLVCMSIAEDGHVLGSHVCSHIGYMRGDLTGSDRRKEHLAAHYPDGYEIVELPEGEAPPQEVLDRNAALTPDDDDSENQALPS